MLFEATIEARLTNPATTGLATQMPVMRLRPCSPPYYLLLKESQRTRWEVLEARPRPKGGGTMLDNLSKALELEGTPHLLWDGLKRYRQDFSMA